MRVFVKDNELINFIKDKDYDGGRSDEFLKDITSYASDIDMKDVEQNLAWKFKIVDGELQYDVEKIKEKLNNDIIRKRQARYNIEVDPLTLEAIRLGVSTSAGIALKTEANNRVAQIKLELPKLEV